MWYQYHGKEYQKRVTYLIKIPLQISFGLAKTLLAKGYDFSRSVLIEARKKFRIYFVRGVVLM